MDVAEFLAVIALDKIGVDQWRARSLNNGWTRVFGGQILAQALIAAERSVDNRLPHALHAHFILPGDPKAPIVFDVERVRDGRSFSVRRVVARQKEEIMFIMSLSFQAEEEGALHHALPMPSVPKAEEVADLLTTAQSLPEALAEGVVNVFERIRPIEVRPLDGERYSAIEPHATPDLHHNLWIRLNGALPNDPSVHRAALAYLSDLTMLETVLVAHGLYVERQHFQMASLDHALWLHRPVRADEWLLYTQETPSAQSSRGLTRGLLYTPSGVLAATSMQEGLIRKVL